MDYSPWDQKESDTTEQLTLSLDVESRDSSRLLAPTGTSAFQSML